MTATAFKHGNKQLAVTTAIMIILPSIFVYSTSDITVTVVFLAWLEFTGDMITLLTAAG